MRKSRFMCGALRRSGPCGGAALVDERTPTDLASFVPRQVVHELICLRDLVRREPRLRVGSDVGFGYRTRGLDDGVHTLPPQIVGKADDDDVADRGMITDRGLDLSRIHVRS